MYTHTIKKLPKKTYEIEVTIPWNTIQQEYKIAFELLHKDFEFEGFRKGKVPKSIAEKHMPKDTVYEKLMRTLLSKIYQEIIEKESLRPITSPIIDLVSAKEKEDWKVKIVMAETPDVDLGDYKKIIADAKAEIKKNDIWVPGKGAPQSPQTEEKKEQNKQELLNKVLKTLLEKTKCEIADIIIDEEVKTRLARLVDEVQKVGLTVESYLKSRNLTVEQLKEQYRKEIEDTYKLEFILQKLADQENIKVEKEDLDKLFQNITDEKQRQAAQANAYMYASVLRKQKTLDLLTSL